MQDLYIIGLLLVCFAIFMAVVHYAQKLVRAKHETIRAYAHIAAGTLAAIAPIFLSPKIIIIVSGIVAITFFMTRELGVLSGIHGVQRITWGEIFAPIGIGVCAFFFLPGSVLAYQFGALVMGLSDAIASLVGRAFGTKKLLVFSATKTVEGSLAFFITTLTLLLLVNPAATPLWIILIPLVLMFLEMILIYGLDDLALPIVAALLLEVSLG